MELAIPRRVLPTTAASCASVASNEPPQEDDDEMPSMDSFQGGDLRMTRRVLSTDEQGLGEAGDAAGQAPERSTSTDFRI